MTDTAFRRDNHYVPCGYLKRWASDKGLIWTYRVLVSHPKVPYWKLSSPAGVAYHSHLYTQLVAGRESDKIERWLGSEFESPVQESLEKATSDARLSSEDWRLLIRFLAAQDVRTPAWFQEQFKRWEEWVPKLLEDTLRESVAELERAAETKQPPRQQPPASRGHELPVRVTTKIAPGRDTGEIRSEIVLSRRLWHWSMRRALEQTWKALHSHRWTILRPPGGITWFTSDNPVVRLNFNSLSDYNFGGGWGSPGTEIFMPLGPEHLMYTQIDKRPPMKGTRMPAVQADIVRRMIAEHAYRFIFAKHCDDDAPRMRPRIEDAQMFQSERDQWVEWHDRQTDAERELLDDQRDKQADDQ